jgi:aryl-alcohol dehydrogenase-like predicted oxidoreductase
MRIHAREGSMKTTRLGSNGPDISVVGHGTWGAGGMWGTNPPEDEMIAAMRASFDAGVNWVDTAEVYGKGYSEELVGRAVDGRPDAMVFTKVGGEPVGTGYKPDEVRAACEKSLKRLSRDVIDLYQIHWPDDRVPLEETWGAMAALVDDGMVRWIGVSNFNRELIERCEAVRHVDSLQPHFSMLWRDPRTDGLLDFCAANGTGVIAYGPLGYGLLTGSIAKDTVFEENDWRGGGQVGYYERLLSPAVLPKNLAMVDALRPIADRLGITLAQLALAWTFHQPGVTGAIAGARRLRNAEQNVGAGDVTLSGKDLEEIEAVLANA